MEGYVWIKSSFNSTRVWAVLDDQQLTFYDEIDLKEQRAKNVRSNFNIQNATITKVSDSFGSIKFGIKIKCVNGSSTSIDCREPKVWNTWFNVLSDSSHLHEEKEKAEALPKIFCDHLKIDPNAKLSKKIISKAYKKLCLKVHPDKGGSVSNFNLINQAYNALMSLQTEIDDKEGSRTIDFEVILEKGGEGVGLGLVVYEDKVRKKVLVQSVQDNIIMHGISPEAEGSIKPGDALVVVDQDDCSHWFLSRIRARLNNFRIPIGSKVHLTFERRIPLDNIASSQDERDIGIDLDFVSPTTNGDENESNNFYDIDENVNEEIVEEFNEHENANINSLQSLFPGTEQLHESKNNISNERSFANDEIFEISVTNRDNNKQSSAARETAALLEEEIAALSRQNSELEEKMNEFKVENESLKSVCASMQAATASTRQEVYLLETKLEKASRANNSAHADVIQLTEQLATLNKAFEDKLLSVPGGISRRLMEVQEELITANEEKRSLKISLSSLRTTMKNKDFSMRTGGSEDEEVSDPWAERLNRFSDREIRAKNLQSKFLALLQ